MNRPAIIAVIIILAALAVPAVWWMQFTPSNAPRIPSVDSAQQQAGPSTSLGNMYASMTGDEFDRAYLADMLAHHQGALNMASYALGESSDQRIVTLSRNILSAQTAEVQQMLAWQKEWGYIDGSDPHAGHAMEAGGGMGADMASMEARLYGSSGATFDKEFLTVMILHHQEAVEMSRYAATNAKHQELKDLAQRIIRDQNEEIADMQQRQREASY